MRYDAVLKRLLTGDPISWTKLLRLEGLGPLKLIDTEFHSTTARVDKLIQVDGKQKWLIHVEFQAGYDKRIGIRIARYSAMIEYEMKLPVMSVLVLLTPNSDGRACNGIWRGKLPFRKTCYHEFQFDVIRVWEQPREYYLKGGLGTLPLALLSKVKFHELPGIIDQIKRRVDVEIPVESERTEFWAITEILLGAIYEKSIIESLLKGIANMRESSVVIGYLEEGRKEGRKMGRQEGLIEEARHLLLRVGTRKLGEPKPSVRQKIDAISDVEQIEQLAEHVIDATSWSELFRKK